MNLVHGVHVSRRVDDGNAERARTEDHPVVPARSSDGKPGQLGQWAVAGENEVVDVNGRREKAFRFDELAHGVLPGAAEIKFLPDVDVQASSAHEMRRREPRHCFSDILRSQL